MLALNSFLILDEDVDEALRPFTGRTDGKKQLFEALFVVAEGYCVCLVCKEDIVHTATVVEKHPALRALRRHYLLRLWLC